MPVIASGRREPGAGAGAHLRREPPARLHPEFSHRASASIRCRPRASNGSSGSSHRSSHRSRSASACSCSSSRSSPSVTGGAGSSSSSHMELIDIGVNLAHDSFDADRDAVMAARVGRGRGADGGHGLERRKHAQGHRARRRTSPACLFATAGVHPHHAADLTADTLPALRDLARDAARGGGRRMRARLLPRFLAARPATPRLRLAARARGGDRQARVPAPARRARRLHRHPARASREQRASRTASRPAKRNAMPISSSACTSASPAGSTTSAAACICARSSKASPPTG